MPYIEYGDRKKYDDALEPLLKALEFSTAGDLNYVITQIVQNRWRAMPKYERICVILGTLDAVAREFYRRVAAPYENEKIHENGDVYRHSDGTPASRAHA